MQSANAGMPEGNLVLSQMIQLVTLSLSACQQSSRFTYLYPLAARPVLTSQSAVYLTTCSLSPLQLYLFQEFQPIGGVLPNPLSRQAPMDATSKRTISLIFIIINPTFHKASIIGNQYNQIKQSTNSLIKHLPPSSLIKSYAHLYRFKIYIDDPAQLQLHISQNSHMSREKHLNTIAELRKEAQRESKAKQPHEKYYSSIGLVVDCSNVYRYENSRDFTQKLKIIDTSVQDSPLQVYLWSNRKDDFSLNVKVGDILLINNFKIAIYNENLQAKKAFKVQDSYFRIFSGNTEANNYSPIDKKVGLDDEDGSILTALLELRKFSKTYFKNNKVPLLFKQQGKQKKGEPKRITSSDFDIILRVVDSIEVSSHFKIRLNNDKEDYQLNYTRHIEPGVYKIRSVADAKWEDKLCSLTGNDYTYFLQILPWMKSYDSKEWDRLVPTNQSKVRKIKHAKIESVVSPKKKVNKLTLQQLIAKDDHEEQVRVVVEVMDIMTSFQQALKKFDRENHTEKIYQSETGQYIFSIHLLISDNSLNGQVFNAYIYTYDGKGLQFLPDLHPSGIFGRNIIDYRLNYENFVNRLLEQSDFAQAPLEIVLSPLFNGKETIYRIVDTTLVF